MSDLTCIIVEDEPLAARVLPLGPHGPVTRGGLKSSGRAGWRQMACCAERSLAAHAGLRDAPPPPAQAGEPHIELTWTAAADADEAPPSGLPFGLQALRFAVSEDAQAEMHAEGKRWTWSRHA